MQSKKLEHYKFFQLFAWALFLLFVFFVYLLIKDLKTVTTNLEDSTQSKEEQILDLESKINIYKP
ncbi:MAG: hypothetical protein H6779_01765 [Candidatus Nomurabacteria bacterium]|nr:hypothetical protein [Candidatus Nomurabacteria bacterium]USN88155.1 MAG: hypothetical protein H6779_01765 [Candidatus Nomurabacteria bacterium]